VTKKTEEEETFIHQVISGRRILVGYGCSGNSRIIISSKSCSHVYTSCRGGSTTKFIMEGQDPTIWLPEFQGEGSDDLESICLSMRRYWKISRL
jgi:hypothetical protein